MSVKAYHDLKDHHNNLKLLFWAMLLIVKLDCLLEQMLQHLYIMYHSKYADTSADINLLVTNDLSETNVNSREIIIVNTESISVHDTPPSPPLTPPPPHSPS